MAKFRIEAPNRSNFGIIVDSVITVPFQAGVCETESQQVVDYVKYQYPDFVITEIVEEVAPAAKSAAKSVDL